MAQDDERQAKVEVQRCLADLDEWLARQAIAERHIAGLTKIIDGYFDMYPDLASELNVNWSITTMPGSSSATPPSGADLARELLQTHAGEWWTVSEILNNLRSRGIVIDSDNPANVIRAALERFVKSDDSDMHKSQDRNDRIIYCYDPDRERPPVANEPGAYDPDEEPF